MSAQSQPITFLAAGEVCVNRDDPESIVESVVPVFAKADIKFCQLETLITEKGVASQEPINLRAHPRNIDALKAVGIDVTCFASNHTMDWGNEALLDTIEQLRLRGIQTFGVGANLAEARKPALVECNGTRMAFLGYNCNLPQDYWAASDRRPGCAALRIITHYELANRIHAGGAPIIHTFADRRDLIPMLESVRKAKEVADVVAVSMHWGLFMPADYLTDYQRDVARQLIDAGADMILGTGPHQIKPIEVYKGKVIFYSLGNFAFDFGRKSGIDMEKMLPNFREHAHRMGWELDEEWLDNFCFAVTGRRAMVGKWIIDSGKIQKVSFLPLSINKFAQPRLHSNADDEFDQITQYVQELCKGAKLDTKFSQGENEVIIQT